MELIIWTLNSKLEELAMSTHGGFGILSNPFGPLEDYWHHNNCVRQAPMADLVQILKGYICHMSYGQHWLKGVESIEKHSHKELNLNRLGKDGKTSHNYCS